MCMLCYEATAAAVVSVPFFIKLWRWVKGC